MEYTAKIPMHVNRWTASLVAGGKSHQSSVPKTVRSILTGKGRRQNERGLGSVGLRGNSMTDE